MWALGELYRSHVQPRVQATDGPNRYGENEGGGSLWPAPPPFWGTLT